MRVSIGAKIFGIAVCLAGVMVIAAYISTNRVASTERRIAVLVDDIIPLLERSDDLREVVWREQLTFSEENRVSDDAANQLQGDKLRTETFETLARAMAAELHDAVGALTNVDRRLSLTDAAARLDALVDAHRGLQDAYDMLRERDDEQSSEESLEVVSLVRKQVAAFEAAQDALEREIRIVADGLAQQTETDEVLAISFENLVTGIAAALGLLLAGILTQAIVARIRNLQSASHAVRDGDLSLQIVVRGNDEVADLAHAFNEMIGQLRRKEKTEAIFGRYLDPRVIESLINETGEDEEELSAATKQDATVMFTDIAGYTSISELLKPAALVRLMNEYFQVVGEPIGETGGVLDKFIGDAVMAFWCEPFVRAEETGHYACDAALKQLDCVRQFQTRIPEITGLRLRAPKINVRIGLATGDVLVGSIGSPNKRNFTVIGDTVNISSRLESASKLYGTQILICQNTQATLPENYVTRYVDSLAFVGKSEPVHIYELIANEPVPERAEEVLSLYADGIGRYRDRDWTGAAQSMQACLRLDPEDGPARTMLNRIEQFMQTPPDNGWDGVWRLTHK
ncbi:adenylate/guanylate cyclase domain-containing protein [Rhodospirillaceae bacterium KN72]|uniref:Adenylate/guanylate cyclase domain-containing protein n=1 Tax=Pacificispira spongiicola TaxID=2729598 RepID=A0A7Y0DYI1_9PROT|nr:adenylate/guanylate cyclase domain-containing protein [Pacificispira spongiicola]NMM43946.1 adenylate/guanylate cyclase domain-containing protein [Pacificispira spongiicola]